MTAMATEIMSIMATYGGVHILTAMEIYLSLLSQCERAFRVEFFTVCTKLAEMAKKSYLWWGST